MLIIVNKNPSAFFYSKATYRLPESDNKQKDTRIQKKERQAGDSERYDSKNSA